MRRRAHRPPLDHPGVVLNAGAVAQLLHHLDVVHGALLDALGLDELALPLKEGHPLLQLPIDLLDSGVHLLLGGDIVGGRPDGDVVQPPDGGAGDHVDLTDAVDLVPEKLDAQGGVLPVGGPDLHCVPTDPEHIALKGNVVALIADGHQLFQQFVPFNLRPHPEGDHHLLKIFRLAQAVDAGDGGDHDHVPPLQQGGGGGQAQAVDLLIDGGVLFNEGICMGDVGLRLVVVVVGDEILHRIVGEKFPELGAQLGGQSLVVGQHQGGALDLLNDLGHGEGLARAGDAQQSLLVQPHLQSAGQGRDGFRLISGGLIFRNNFKFRHLFPSSPLCFLHCTRTNVLLQGDLQEIPPGVSREKTVLLLRREEERSSPHRCGRCTKLPTDSGGARWP